MFLPLLKTSSLGRTKPHSLHHLHSHHLCLRFFVEVRVPWVRDRGLDHVVEKEKHLKPMIALKNLIKSEPAKSIPISIAAENKTQLCLPTRAIDFIRRYPSIFQEFLPPGGSPARPYVRLTPEVLHLDGEEQVIYESTEQRQDAADRLLRLLMLTRVNKLPLHLVDSLKWDLGLPHDYVKSLVTDYPDYFQICSINKEGEKPAFALELVCWTDELAVSAMEKKAAKSGEDGYKKGMPLSFPLQFSRGFDLEKKVKKWIDEWQKLPYISPYENALHLDLKSDQGEKWIVAVLHEILHILVSKKTERDNILCLGEYLGLRSGFKRALINHPGIFYTSNKISTHTVVLREAYKRDLLIEKHPLMGMRYRYIHLMNKLVEEVKPNASQDKSRKKRKKTRAEKKEGEDEDESEGEDEEFKNSDDENENENVDDDDEEEDDDDDEDEDEDEEDEDEDELDGHQIVGKERMSRNQHIEKKMPLKSAVKANSNGRQPNMVNDRVPVTNSRRRDSHKERDSSERSPKSTERSSGRFERSPGRFDRSPGRFESSAGRFDRSPGRFDRSAGRTERSPGRFERSPGRTERSLGAFERSPGRTERSPQSSERSPWITDRSPGRAERPSGRTERSPGRVNTSRTTGRLETARTSTY